MKKHKLSPWFLPHDKPVNVGVYSTFCFDMQNWYSYWDGQLWGAMGKTQEIAHSLRDRPAYQEKTWRGIVK